MSFRASVLVVVTLAACSADRAKTVSLSAPATHAVEPVDASLLPAPTARAPEHACLMLYECGCNAGCTEVDRPLASLRAGMQVGVLSGPLKGTTVFVVKSRADDGEAVFTVQRNDPSAPIVVCGSPSSPLVGYLCATDKLGAARACASCNP